MKNRSFFVLSIVVLVMLFAIACTSDPIISKPWESDVSWYDESKKEFSLENASQLAGLATIVNAGNELEGVTIKLAKDIDLENKPWTPIGRAIADSAPYGNKDDKFYGFRGTFDGDGHQISNLTIEDRKVGTSLNTDISFLGLFGVVESGATVKNLTMRNVEIYGDSYIGSFVGYLPNSSKAANTVTLENLKLTGNVSILAATNAGGIMGRNESSSPALLINKCVVDVDNGSKIETIYNTPFLYTNKNETVEYQGYADFVGGIIGAAYGKDNVNVIENCSVKNIDLKAQVLSVGGISGLFGKGKISNCSVAGVLISLDREEPLDGDNKCKGIGVIVGCTVTAGAGDIAIDTVEVSGSTIAIPLAKSDDFNLAYKGYVGIDRNGEQDNSRVVTGVPEEASGFTVKFTK